MRDEFSSATIKNLAARVGHRCSNPSCKQPTSGPRLDTIAGVSIGVGAHITAASPGGPRFDSSLTTEQRRAIDNGIWLCQNCAKLVDDDEQRFPAGLLHTWKQRAEADALVELKAADETGQPRFAILERTLKAHTNFVWDVAVTPDGRRALSASNDKTVKMWDLATGNLLATFSEHTSFVCSISIAPDGSRLAAGALDGSIKVWNIHSGDVVAHLHHGSYDAKVAWSPIDDYALTSGRDDGVLRVWNVRDLSCVRGIPCHRDPILKVVYLADGLRVVSVSADKTVKICRLDDGACLRVFTGHTGEINSVAVSCDQRIVLSASEDQTVRSWNIVPGIVWRRYTGILKSSGGSLSRRPVAWPHREVQITP